MSAPHNTLPPRYAPPQAVPFSAQSYPQHPQFGPPNGPQYMPPTSQPYGGPPLPPYGGWPYMGGDFNPRNPRRGKDPKNKVLAILAAFAVLIAAGAIFIPRLSPSNTSASPSVSHSSEVQRERHTKPEPVEPGPAPRLNIPLGSYTPEKGLPEVSGTPAAISVEASRAAADIGKYWKEALRGEVYWDAPWHYYSLDNGKATYNEYDDMATCMNTPYVRVVALCNKTAIAWNAQQLTVLQEHSGNPAAMLAVGTAYGHYVLAWVTKAEAWNTSMLYGSACMSAITMAEYAGWSYPMADSAERVMDDWLSAEGYTGDLADSVRAAIRDGLQNRSYKTCAEYVS